MNYSDRFDFDLFVSLIDNLYDECAIWDKDLRLIYINKAAYRHYGLHPDQMVGRPLDDLVGKEKYWYPTTLHHVRRYKQSIMQEQVTILGVPILTITVPILDQYGEVEYCVMTSRDDYQELAKKLSPVIKVDNAYSPPEDEHIIHKSDVMKEVVGLARLIARTDAACMLLGETGTGKGMLARYIHDHSPRARKGYFSINMASLNPNVIEAELFGYHKGAFTGAAKEGKKGYFELADGGTLVLDELGELPLDLQAKFLHVIQEGEFTPLGGTRPIKTDIRFISSTNRDLQDMVEAGRFREDLYHRLNVFDLTLPPLRERGEDLLMLSAYYLNIFNKKYNRNCTLAEKTRLLLKHYKWSGNVRELSNVLERCVVISKTDIAQPEDLPRYFFKGEHQALIKHPVADVSNLPDAVSAYEREIVSYHYDRLRSSRKLAAALNVSQTTARRLIDKYVKKTLPERS